MYVCVCMQVLSIYIYIYIYIESLLLADGFDYAADESEYDISVNIGGGVDIERGGVGIQNTSSFSKINSWGSKKDSFAESV